MTGLIILFSIAVYILVLYAAFRFALAAMHVEEAGQEDTEQKEIIRNDGNDSIN